jgi:hypothetical protein
LRGLLTISGNSDWSDTYAYDGFANFDGHDAKRRGAPTLSVPVSSATNQISPTNILYDNNGYGSNGNVTQFGPSGSLTTLAYDVATLANRCAAAEQTTLLRLLRVLAGLDHSLVAFELVRPIPQLMGELFASLNPSNGF